MATSTRRRPRKTKATTEERRAHVASLKQSLKDRLDEWQEEAGDELIALALATHDGYSDRNAMLIAMQCPTATDVAGFKAWIDRGRRVRKGEHGIQILAPAGEYRENGEGQRERIRPGDDFPGGEAGEVFRFFRLAYVFDVSQTDPAEPGEAAVGIEEAMDGALDPQPNTPDSPLLVRPIPAADSEPAQLDLFGEVA